MTRKRLTRDQKWFFQYFPYQQMRIETDLFHGLASIIKLTDGEYFYWDFPLAGKTAVAGKGMTWLQLIPDNGKRAITVKFLPDKRVSVWYVDVIDHMEYDPDGIACFLDTYLDVIFTPQGDIKIDDRDELDQAFHNGEFTETEYLAIIAEGDAIVRDLCSNIPATELWCQQILDYVEELLRPKKFVLFLDIDGVLDIYNPSRPVQTLLPEAVARLKHLVARTNGSIVLASDWRYGSRENRMVLNKTFQQEGLSIAGETPYGNSFQCRTEEILAYLQAHPEIYNYVILDDCYGDDYSSNEIVRQHLVHVDALKGLQDCDLMKACEIMNRQGELF